MAAIKISDLPSVETPTLSDVLPSVNNGETKKITLEQIKNLAGGGSGSLDSDFYTYYLESRKSAFIEGYGGMSSSDFPFFQNIINKYRNKNTKPCILLKANVSTKNNSSTCLLTNIEYTDSEVAFYGVAFGLGSYTNIQSSLYSVSTMNIRFTVTTTNETITITNGIMCESFARKFLSTDNKISYTPTNDYNPATKKYVDDAISNTVGTIETTLQTINSGSGV